MDQHLDKTYNWGRHSHFNGIRPPAGNTQVNFNTWKYSIKHTALKKLLPVE